VEGARRPVDDAQELPLVVRQVDGVQLARELLQRRQIAPLDVADDEHGPLQRHSSSRICSYIPTALSSWEISMRSLAVCALPVERPGPITTAWQPARANTPASVLVGLARGAGSRPTRASARPAETTSSASSANDIPAALRVISTCRESSSPPSLRTHSCARSSKRARNASGSCPGKRRASSVACATPSP